MTLKRFFGQLLFAGVAAGLMACSADKPEPHVAFVQPVDGATVGRTFKVVMAVEGMTVHAAGDVIPGTGHHHIIIDGGLIPMNEAIPSDRHHIHFGKGQTEGTVHLLPGKHTLTLQFANGHHKSYGRALGKTITINVK